MTKITELADKWLKRAIRQRQSVSTSSAADQFDKGESKGVSDCADELTEALPKWTRITEDKATWPDKGQLVIVTGAASVVGRNRPGFNT